MTMVVSAFAQQSLMGGQTTKSPEINPDGTVTFRLIAPKARTVQITGDFIPPVQADMNGTRMDTPHCQYGREGRCMGVYHSRA